MPSSLCRQGVTSPPLDRVTLPLPPGQGNPTSRQSNFTPLPPDRVALLLLSPPRKKDHGRRTSGRTRQEGWPLHPQINYAGQYRHVMWTEYCSCVHECFDFGSNESHSPMLHVISQDKRWLTIIASQSSQFKFVCIPFRTDQFEGSHALKSVCKEPFVFGMENT